LKWKGGEPAAGVGWGVKGRVGKESNLCVHAYGLYNRTDTSIRNSSIHLALYLVTKIHKRNKNLNQTP